LLNAAALGGAYDSSLVPGCFQVKHEHESFDQQVDGIKRRIAGHAKERLLHEKKVKKLQADRDKRVGQGMGWGAPQQEHKLWLDSCCCQQLGGSGSVHITPDFAAVALLVACTAEP
jgi:hypothetical protein